MIFKKYGTTMQSVDVDFDARAMTEVGFRRNRETSIPTDEFESTYTHVESRELTAEAAGDVQDAAEKELLANLESTLRAFEAELGDGEVLLIESEQGVDYPKTRDEKTTLVVGHENKLRFTWTIDPPLRVGRYRKGD